MLDIFFQTEYGKLYEKIEKGTCEFFEYSDAWGVVRNMFIKRPVPWLIDGAQYYDVTTPYGYGGPMIVSGDVSEELVSAYFDSWSQYCKENHIIAEFVRFHLYDNIAFREQFSGQVIHVSDNVVRSLDESIDTIWMQVEHKVRKNVKKAQGNKLNVTIDFDGEHLDEFLEIYYSTMKRNNARDYYYFDRTYFERIIETLPNNFAFFNVWHENKIISTELVLCSEKYVYSFLGGTLEEYYPMRPNDLLKWEIINWSKETGRKSFILGGGYGTNDGIYRYKKAFAPGADVPFYVGRMIHDQKVYDRLVAERKKKDGMNQAFFPLYRV